MRNLLMWFFDWRRRRKAARMARAVEEARAKRMENFKDSLRCKGYPPRAIHDAYEYATARPDRQDDTVSSLIDIGLGIAISSAFSSSDSDSNSSLSTGDSSSSGDWSGGGGDFSGGGSSGSWSND